MPPASLTEVTPLPAANATPAKKITVLHLIHSVCHGGIESAMINWVKNFDRDRFEILVACFVNDRNREAAFLAAAQTNGIEVLPAPWSRWKPFLRCARAVARIVRERNVDIIHTHGYYADAVGVLVKLFAPVRVVVTVYVWGKYEFHRQLMQWMDMAAIRFADCVTAHCEETRRGTIARGIPASEVRTLIAGFPVRRAVATPEQRLAARRAQGVADDEILMINIARIHPEKAHDQLLEAFKLIHDRQPRARLWISGIGWKWLEDQLLELRSRLDLENAVQFIGFRQDLWPLLDAADFMVHPSHVEGVPIAILYGMAAGLPIVISNVGGVTEVIRDGQTGALIPENDVPGFAERVLRLIDHPAEARALGQGARRFVETEYSIETAVRGVEQAYREVRAR
jgi:glycosyltransferase involved in cell wall biosynthesis